MQVFLSATLRRWLPALTLLLALLPGLARATHIRAGDIQAKVDTTPVRNPNRVFFKLTLYVDPNQYKQTSVSIYFGDGTMQANIPRVGNYPVPGRPDTNINTFFFDHTFPGSNEYPGYTVSFVGENRVDQIQNISGGQSVGQTFYVSTTISISPSLSGNHSPVLRAPAVDGGAIGQVYLHNPAGYDADGDSLAYKIFYSQQVPGGEANVTGNRPKPAICTGFVFPNEVGNYPQVTYPGLPTQIPNSKSTFSQDVRTGQVTWNAPGRAGYYNVAMVVEEWRRYAGGYVRPIGTVIRDYQILISSTNNLPPQLTAPTDVCVVAGQPLTLTVSATDGQASGASAPTPVTLFAYSGILPPATFTTSASGTTTTGTFRWTPDCSNVASEPYIVVFKAQDSPSTGIPVLIDEKPVRITVIGPPPQNLNITRVPAALLATNNVSWTRYNCTNADFIRIYRRENNSSWSPGSCETGIPTSAGYTLIGTVPASATSFSDDNAGRGLSRGSTYCYRIYATFPLPAGGASRASDEACLQVPGRAALLTNVDIDQAATSATTGRIAVKWTRPRDDNGGFNFTAPFGYRLLRAEGRSNQYTVAYSTTNLSDTTFVDTNRNTEGVQYAYKLVFYRSESGAELRDSTARASSVRLTLTPDGSTKSITVRWAYTTPWDNSNQPTRIYRRLQSSPTFVKIADVLPTATGGTYLDQDPTLQQNTTYCYYVQTVGQYANYKFLQSLVNTSQQTCVTLRPIPCTPVLTIRAVNCDSLANRTVYPEPGQRYDNQLRWTIVSTPAGCENSATSYRVLRADTEAGPFTQIGVTSSLSYFDQNLPRQNYCYQVQGVSATGEASQVSNIACQTECVFFVLPNIFIPGSAEVLNQTFRPKTASPITRTHIQIFNRWGRKVYESDRDPYINWTGGGMAGESSTSSLVSGGIYYYLAEVEFANAAKTQKVYKGWVELVR